MTTNEEETMDHGQMSRRRFLGTTAGSAAAAAGLGALGGAAPAAAAARGERLLPKPRLGVMLYTVRDLLKADAAGTLAMIADAGYRKVELADPLGRTPEEFKVLLDRNGLRPIAYHQWIPPVFGQANPEAVLDTAEALGLKYSGSSLMTLPGVEEQNADLYKRLADQANQWGALAAERGIRFYYHNHNWEFAKDPRTGEVFYEILLEETDPKLVFFELDLFWIHYAGFDPLDYIQGAQKRFPLFHVKDGIPNQSQQPDPGFTDLGKGEIDFKRVFKALKNKNAHHYLLERDTQPDAEKTVRDGYRYLTRLRAKRKRKHAH
ncbi:MAG: sugar phosphate isomerase/epimerase [Solirubrobacteraceae bacterium]